MRVKNTSRKFGADPEYIYTTIEGQPALLTEEAAQEAIDRAEMQPEDLPSLWERFLYWLQG